MLGDAFREVEALRALDRPRLVLTSEFGTMSMWDWEIGRYLAEAGVETFAPYDLEQAHVFCRALALRRELTGTRFVVFQDDPGDGHAGSIFKRFYWWEDECTQRILDRFGVRDREASFKALGEEAKLVSDADADAAFERVRGPHPARRPARAQPARGAEALPGDQGRARRRPHDPAGRASTASTSPSSPTAPPAWRGTCCTRSAGSPGAARPTRCRCSPSGCCTAP
jgi:hypothetical protein